MPKHNQRATIGRLNDFSSHQEMEVPESLQDQVNALTQRVATLERTVNTLLMEVISLHEVIDRPDSQPREKTKQPKQAKQTAKAKPSKVKPKKAQSTPADKIMKLLNAGPQSRKECATSLEMPLDVVDKTWGYLLVKGWVVKDETNKDPDGNSRWMSTNTSLTHEAQEKSDAEKEANRAKNEQQRLAGIKRRQSETAAIVKLCEDGCEHTSEEVRELLNIGISREKTLRKSDEFEQSGLTFRKCDETKTNYYRLSTETENFE